MKFSATMADPRMGTELCKLCVCDIYCVVLTVFFIACVAVPFWDQWIAEGGNPDNIVSPQLPGTPRSSCSSASTGMFGEPPKVP